MMRNPGLQYAWNAETVLYMGGRTRNFAARPAKTGTTTGKRGESGR